MDIMQIVVLAIIVIIIATITLAVLSYGAFKVRESRSPQKSASPEDDPLEPLFFERVRFFKHSPRRQD